MKHPMALACAAALFVHAEVARADLTDGTIFAADRIEGPDAGASPTPVQSDDPKNGNLRWYGGYTLMVDGINIATAVGLVGIGGYFVAAPIVHLHHHEYVRAGISFSLRAGLPLAGRALICGGNGCSGANGGIGEAFGVGAGVFVAMLIDAIAVSWTDAPEKPHATSITPQASIDGSSARIGASMAF